MVPLGRQFIQMTTSQLTETRNLVQLNFKLFHRFSKLFLKLTDHMNPLAADAEKLEREHKSFRNKRLTRQARGIADHHSSDQSQSLSDSSDDASPRSNSSIEYLLQTQDKERHSSRGSIGSQSVGSAESEPGAVDAEEETK